MQAGIDEAGRGPVVGPLVVGLVACEDPTRLDGRGIKDSKVLSPARRCELYETIQKTADRVESVHVGSSVLDERMRRRSLNTIEVELFAELGRRVPADTYYLDACDVNEARFGLAFAQLLGRADRPRVVSEHRADGRYPLVAAASIVAKVERDRTVADIAARLEPAVGLPLGSGYSHDERTRAFLRRHLELFGRLPAEARAAWETSARLTGERWQRSLEGFPPPPA